MANISGYGTNVTCLDANKAHYVIESEQRTSAFLLWTESSGISDQSITKIHALSTQAIIHIFQYFKFCFTYIFERYFCTI